MKAGELQRVTQKNALLGWSYLLKLPVSSTNYGPTNPPSGKTRGDGKRNILLGWPYNLFPGGALRDIPNDCGPGEYSLIWAFWRRAAGQCVDFFGLAVLNRVYNMTCLSPKQGQNLFQAGYGITSFRDFNSGCEQSLSFPRLRKVRLI